MTTRPEVFELLPEHITLLRHANVWWFDCEYGAPGIDPKRPYGNSDGARDVCRVLGWPMEGDDGEGPCYSSVQLGRAHAIHKGLEAALQIVLITGAFEPGTYALANRYDYRSWRRHN